MTESECSLFPPNLLKRTHFRFCVPLETSSVACNNLRVTAAQLLLTILISSPATTPLGPAPLAASADAHHAWEPRVAWRRAWLGGSTAVEGTYER